MTSELRFSPQPDDANEARQLAILTMAKAAFLEKGFDGASMQDLARAAGMSAGNFYRYFPSKAAIVEALVTRDLKEMAQEIAFVAVAPDPVVAIRSGLYRRIMTECGDCGEGALWAEIAATALRKPEIGAISARMEETIFGYLTDAFALATGLPREEAAQKFRAHAALSVMLVKASAMQRRNLDAEDPALARLVARIVDTIVDDISEARSVSEPATKG